MHRVTTGDFGPLFLPPMKTALNYLNEVNGNQREALAAAKQDGIYFNLGAMKRARLDWAVEQVRLYPDKYYAYCIECGHLIPNNERSYTVNGKTLCWVCFDHNEAI